MGIMYKLMKHRNLTMDINKPSYNKRNIKNEHNRLITIDGNIIDAPLTTSVIAADLAVEDITKNMDSNLDKPFTAEHIIQLCKFLAEKSKRNKHLHKQQQSPKKLTKNKELQFSFQPMECDDNYDDDNDDEAELYQNEALPLLSKQRLGLQQKNCAATEINGHNDFDQQKLPAVLATRLSPDINSLNISLNSTTQNSCALQHQQQQVHQQQQQQIIYNHQHQQQLEPQLPQNQGKRDILLKIRRQIFERKRLRENGAFEPQALNNSQVWRPW